MLQRLSTRLWFTYALLIGIVLCIIAASLLVYLIRSPTPARLLFNQLQLIANFLQNAAKLSDTLTFEQMQQTAIKADENFGVRILILDQNRLVIVDSRKNQAAALPARFDRPRIFFGGNNSPTQFTDANRQTWLFVKRDLRNGFLLVVAAQRPKLTLKTLFRDEFLYPFTQAGILALIISLIFAISISRWIAKPLEKIAKTARLGLSEQFSLTDMNSPIEIQNLATALNEMNAKVQSSQRSQRDLVANVSHDLKTPLTSIQGFAQAILDGTATMPEQIHSAAQVIFNETERLNLMVVDLLELARLESGTIDMERSPFELQTLLNNLVFQFSPQLRSKEIELVQDYPHLKIMIGDRDRLTRVFSNLLDNAIKFSPSKTRISIIGRNVEDFAEVKIQDNGPGIPERDLDQVFNRFYQVDKTRSSAQRGAGLGLAIAKEIVYAHSGTISVFNNTNLSENFQYQPGCTFVVTLPYSKFDDVTLAKRL